jgi:hypothetical protein
MTEIRITPSRNRDIDRIWRVAEALEYGIVGINEGIISTEIAPFGGMKESGIGHIWLVTGARNTASRNSSRSNTSVWAASTAELWTGRGRGEMCSSSRRERDRGLP